ncbi:putative ATP-dependent RNA helicase TDRD12 [Orchesella cincta]|uniref:RNA helicase n=1 Tax=Orchesella cincta TaxID=48709 RepID=A0A1D2N5M6_ORCCI|nr:putative ATP-dependent RNA helicase TDRD12 [Orchesella cincta]
MDHVKLKRDLDKLKLESQQKLLFVSETGNLKSAYQSLEELHLHPDIIARLNQLQFGAKYIDDDYLLRIVWSNIVGGSDSVIVAQEISPRSKFRRTLSYLLPILRLLTMNTHESPVPSYSKTNASLGPQALLVCSSVTTALTFEKNLKRLLEGTSVPLKVRLVHTGMTDWKELNSVDILITNVLSICQLMRGREGHKNSTTVNLQRLKYLVMDEVDGYLKLESHILGCLIESATLKHVQKFHVQFVICGSTWTPELKAFHLSMIKKGRTPNLYIEPLAEILNFAEATWQVDYAPDDSKRFERLKETLTQRMASHARCIIACSTFSVAVSILGVCKECNVMSKIVSSELNELATENASEIPTETEVLIVTDDMVSLGLISDCTYMLSFDSSREIPTQSESVERMRLLHIWNALPTLVNTDNWMIQKPVAHFLMTGQEPNFLRFFRFSKNLVNNVYDPELETFGNKLLDEDMHKRPVCKGVELFGYCNAAPGATCSFRHDFMASDFENLANAPFYGEIEFALTECLSPSEYRGTLLTHYEYKQGQRLLLKSFKDETSTRTALLKEHYATYGNKKFPSSFNKENVYAFWSQSEETYKRVKIIGKLPRTVGVDNSDIVNLYCVDSGNTLTASVSDLLSIPKEIASWPPLALRVILTNICPPSREPEYTSEHINIVGTLAKHSTIRAKVELSFVLLSRGETVWVSPMITKTEDKSLGTTSIRPNLIRYLAASLNSGHQDYLIESVRALGTNYHGHKHLPIDMPKRKCTDEIFDLSRPDNTIQWAHLEQSTEDEVIPLRIKTTFGINPWTFYGANVKHRKLLYTLEDELHDWVEAQDRNEYVEFFEMLRPNSIVAAKDADGRWERAMILDMDRQGDQPQYELFSVDFGELYIDTEENIFPIATKFVTRLPFQVVALSLEHVRPRDKSELWSTEEKDAFLDLIIPNGDSVFLDVAVSCKVVGVESPPPCNYYMAVALLNSEELGSKLVRNGMAEMVHCIPRLADALQNKLNSTLDEASSVDVSDLIDNGEESDTDNQPTFEEFLQRFDVCANFSDNPKSSGEKNRVVEDIKAIVKSSLGIQSFKQPQNASEAHVQEADATPIDPSSSHTISDINGTVDEPDSIAIPTAGPSPSTSFEQPTESEDSLLSPTLYWSQSTSEVFLTVKLPEIQAYIVHILMDCRTIQFKTLNPPNYGFELKLFEICTNHNELLTNQQLKIRLKKKFPCNWTRLLFDSDTKLPWIQEDPDYLQNASKDTKIRFGLVRPVHTRMFYL